MKERSGSIDLSPQRITPSITRDIAFFKENLLEYDFNSKYKWRQYLEEVSSEPDSVWDIPLLSYIKGRLSQRGLIIIEDDLFIFKGRTPVDVHTDCHTNADLSETQDACNLLLILDVDRNEVINQMYSLFADGSNGVPPDDPYVSFLLEEATKETDAKHLFTKVDMTRGDYVLWNACLPHALYNHGDYILLSLSVRILRESPLYHLTQESWFPVEAANQ